MGSHADGNLALARDTCGTADPPDAASCWLAPGEPRPIRAPSDAPGRGIRTMSRFTGMTRRDLLARAGAGMLGLALSGTVGACSSAPPSADQPAPTGGTASGIGTQTPVLGSSARPQATTVVGTGPAAVPTPTTTPRSGGTLRYGTIGDFLGLE